MYPQDHGTLVLTNAKHFHVERSYRCWGAHNKCHQNSPVRKMMKFHFIQGHVQESRSIREVPSSNADTAPPYECRFQDANAAIEMVRED